MALVRYGVSSFQKRDCFQHNPKLNTIVDPFVRLASHGGALVDFTKLLRHDSLYLSKPARTGQGLRTAGAWLMEEVFARSGMVAEPREPRKSKPTKLQWWGHPRSGSARHLSHLMAIMANFEDDERSATVPPSVYLRPVLLPTTSALIVNSSEQSTN